MFLDDGFCLLGTEKVCRDFKLALAWGGGQKIYVKRNPGKQTFCRRSVVAFGVLKDCAYIS